MKKLLFFIILLLSTVSMLAQTIDGYFTLGVRDTLWVSPCTMGNGVNVSVKAHFEKRVDNWQLTFSYPTGMTPQYVEGRQDMCRPYINSDGDTVTLVATLTTNSPQNTIIASSITETGYWYHNGIFSSYGNVKWEPGDYSRMFDIFFEIDNSTFSGGSMLVYGVLSSDHDSRGNYIDQVLFGKYIEVVKGNMRGDVNGDGILSIDDLTALINYLLNPDAAAWDEYQIAAADVNYSGTVTVVDVTALSSLIMSQG